MKYTSIIALIATFGLGAPAFADHGQQGSVGTYQSQGQKQFQGQQQMEFMGGQQVGKMRISGELTNLRRVNISGDPQPHILAKIRTDAGHTFVVDLGTTENLQGINLSTGQEISVVGRSGRLNQRPILIADTLHAGPGQVVSIARRPIQPGMQMQESVRVGQALESAPRGPQGQVMLSGHIIGLQDVQLRGMPEPHTIAKIRTMEGQTALIDLGPQSEVADLQLQKNDFVSASGSVGRINNQQVLIADVVADVELINRMGGPQGQEQMLFEMR